MIIYIVSDIFGITSALKEFVTSLHKLLSEQEVTVFIVDPYQGQQMNFYNEAAAYSYFIKHVGVENYAEHLYSILSTQAVETEDAYDLHEVNVVGFSVGAAAIWAISAKENINVANAFYFYGSQIRHLLDIHPKIKSTLILPIQEEHFDVDLLQEKLLKLANVSTNRCSFYHGFMNKLSVNFNEQAYRTYTGWLCERLRLIS